MEQKNFWRSAFAALLISHFIPGFVFARSLLEASTPINSKQIGTNAEGSSDLSEQMSPVLNGSGKPHANLVVISYAQDGVTEPVPRCYIDLGRNPAAAPAMIQPKSSLSSSIAIEIGLPHCDSTTVNELALGVAPLDEVGAYKVAVIPAAAALLAWQCVLGASYGVIGTLGTNNIAETKSAASAAASAVSLTIMGAGVFVASITSKFAIVPIAACGAAGALATYWLIDPIEH